MKVIYVVDKYDVVCPTCLKEIDSSFIKDKHKSIINCPHCNEEIELRLF